MSLRSNVLKVPGIIPVARTVRQAFRGRNFTPFYNEDCLITNHWLTTDARFDAAYKKAGQRGLGVDANIKWRAHVICWAALRGSKLEGVFVECGVNRGFMARIVCDYIDALPDFYLLDTYKGFDEKTLSASHIAQLKAASAARKDGRDWRQGRYEECYNDAIKTFADKPNVHIIRGTVPDTLSQVQCEKVAYLSLDMNCALPEIEAINYFWPKMSSGATVVLDDYGHLGHDEQRHAFDQWSLEHGAPLLAMPTGQGVLIKP